MPDLEKGLNPATWMLQISSTGMESSLGLDFADVYRESALFKCVPMPYNIYPISYKPYTMYLESALFKCVPALSPSLESEPAI